jgi:hypothetical protein
VIPVLAMGFALILWFNYFRHSGAGRLVRADDVVTVNWRTPGARAWMAIVAFQAVLFGGGLVAMNTGEREEERVERVVPEAALERHEEAAEQFVWAAGATLGLAALVLMFRRPPVARLFVTTTAVASLVVAALAVRVGKAGGELVYAHNAGAAYASSSRSAATVPSRHAPAPPMAQAAAGGDDEEPGERRARERRR